MYLDVLDRVDYLSAIFLSLGDKKYGHDLFVRQHDRYYKNTDLITYLLI